MGMNHLKVSWSQVSKGKRFISISITATVHVQGAHIAGPVPSISILLLSGILGDAGPFVGSVLLPPVGLEMGMEEELLQEPGEEWLFLIEGSD